MVKRDFKQKIIVSKLRTTNSSGQGPTSSSASAVSTLGNSSTSQSSAVAKPAVGAQGMTPLLSQLVDRVQHHLDLL